MKGRAMRIGWVLLGLLTLSTGALAENERYQALPLAGTEGGKGGARAFVLDTRDGHVWIWSENELITTPDGGRRYGSGFSYQGKLRPGTQPGEFIETPRK
ncbi:hypothetical protein [uncultured Thiobacillus sp.]|uniref:hypothetical protein n=1 Tax=uncultured Thiobacillus sp. TaxID=189996 RepID=UPI002638B230|nr:hypothetical protein [uncultured Thiobacillus sp.]